MHQFFSLQTAEELNNLAGSYLPLVKVTLNTFGIVPETIKGDHFGIITTSSEDFAACHENISTYADLIGSGLIKGRRNNIYRLRQPIEESGFVIPRIEIFGYEPQENDRFLKYGLDHVAFKVENFDHFLSEQQAKKIPIERVVDGYHPGSKFFKTKTINNVMIEFRNDFLGEWHN